MTLSTSATSGLADRLPPQAPSHLGHILAELDEADRVDAPNSGLKALREAFAFLLGHFADLVASCAIHLGSDAVLFSRDEDDIVSVSEAEHRLKEGLYVLNDKIESVPVARALAEVFFDLRDGTPRSFYLLAQGGNVGSAVGLGLKRLSELCKPPTRSPGRSEAFKTVGQYRPHLQAWLEMAGRFWSQCTVESEHTSLKARQRSVYRFGDAVLNAGLRCDLNGCRACIPSRVIEVPAELLGKKVLQGFPSNVPEHSLHLVDRFCEALVQKDILASTRLMRDTFEFLLRYFAGVAKTLCEAMDVFPEAARRPAKDTESVDNCERVLQLCVDALKPHQDDPAARAVVGVFYRRTASLELEPRSHTGVLLLEGVLSSWFKRERGLQPSADRSKADFERFFPLLGDWLGAMYPYFSQCEHFDEPPNLDGHLPLTVRLGDHLLEMVAPAYTLRIRQCPICLPNPNWLRSAPAAAPATVKPQTTPSQTAAEEGQALAAPEAPVPSPTAPAPPPSPEDTRAFPGEFRPVDVVPDGPKFLLRVIRRLDVYVRRGELPEARTALRDCLDYLVRYWAGVAEAVARISGTLSDDLGRLARESLSIQQCERLLTSCLQGFTADTSPLAQEVMRVFYDLDIITDELKPNGSHSRMLKMDSDAGNKMQLLAEFCEHTDVADARRSRSDLKTYLPVLRDWLARSQPFFEQCQHHEEEPDKQGRMELVVQFDQTYLELVAPDFDFYVKLGSDQVPDLEVPDWVEPEEPEEEKVEKRVVAIRPDELAMSEPFLLHKVTFVGLRENSKGVLCKSGKIKIENAGGGSLTGRAFSNHPCIEVAPARFRDNTQLDYWLDEKEVPRDYVPTLTLRSGGDQRTITVAEMRPISGFATLSKLQALTLLFLPPTVLFLLLLIDILNVRGEIMAMCTQSGIAIASLKTDPRLSTMLSTKAESVGWPFLAYPVISGIIVFALFRRFSHVMQDLTQKPFDTALVAPAVLSGILVLAIMLVGVEVCNSPFIKPMNLVQLYPWSLVFNCGIWGYTILNHRGKIAEWIPEPIFRKLVAPILFIVFLALSTLPLIF